MTAFALLPWAFAAFTVVLACGLALLLRDVARALREPTTDAYDIAADRLSEPSSPAAVAWCSTGNPAVWTGTALTAQPTGRAVSTSSGRTLRAVDPCPLAPVIPIRPANHNTASHNTSPRETA